MPYSKRPGVRLSTLLILVLLLTACIAPQLGTQASGAAEYQNALTDMKKYAFAVKGVSGKEVMLDRTSAIPGGWWK